MKKLLIASALGISLFALSSCTPPGAVQTPTVATSQVQEPELTAPSSSVPADKLSEAQKDQIKTEVQSVAQMYFSAIISGKDSASKMVAAEPVIPGLSSEGKKKLLSSGDFSSIDSMSESDQAAVAKFFEDSTPATKYVKTEGLTASQRTMVALVNIYTSTISSVDKVIISPDDIILIDSNNAIWRNTLTDGSTANSGFPFTRTAQGWLLDGKAFSNMLKTVQASETATPSPTK